MVVYLSRLLFDYNVVSRYLYRFILYGDRFFSSIVDNSSGIFPFDKVYQLSNSEVIYCNNGNIHIREQSSHSFLYDSQFKLQYKMFCCTLLLVHYCCILLLYTTVVHCCCTLLLCTTVVHYYCT